MALMGDVLKNISDISVLFEQGLNFLEAEKYSLARQCFEQVLQHAPDDMEAHANMGLVCFFSGEYAGAASHWAHALHQSPEEDLFLNVKEAAHWCRNQGLYDEAAALYELIIDRYPKLAISYFWSLRYSLRIDQAKQFAEDLVQQHPKSLEARLMNTFLLPQFYQSEADMQAWHQRLYLTFERLKQDWERGAIDKVEVLSVGSPLFDVMALGQNESTFLKSVSRFWRDYTGVGEGCSERVATLPVSAESMIKVAWVSFSVTDHSTMAYFQTLLQYFFRQPEIENAIFYVGPNSDHVTQAMSAQADYFLHLDTTDLHRVKTLIAAWQPHVLFYLDIGQEAFLYTLAHHRLAPIQAVSVGIPITTGISTIDYYFSAKCFETSTSQAHYSEKLIAFDSPPWQVMVPPSNQKKTRKDFGLPEAGVLFLFPHTLFRFDPTLDAVCADILSRVEKSYLVLIRYKQTHLHEAIKERIIARFPKIAPQIIELPWMSQGDFLSLLELADVALDSLYLGGGLVSYQCFAAGLPMLHRSTEELRCRVAAGLYRQCDLEEWIAKDLPDYVQKGVQLGQSASLRHTLKTAILEAIPTVFQEERGLYLLCEFIKQQARNPH